MRQTRLREAPGTLFIAKPSSESFQDLPPSSLAWMCAPNQALFTAA